MHVRSKSKLYMLTPKVLRKCQMPACYFMLCWSTHNNQLRVHEAHTVFVKHWEIRKTLGSYWSKESPKLTWPRLRFWYRNTGYHTEINIRLTIGKTKMMENNVIYWLIAVVPIVQLLTKIFIIKSSRAVW